MTTNSGIMLALNQILVRLLLPFPHFIVLLFPSYPEESVYAKWSVVIGGLNSVLVDRPLTKTYDKQKWIPGSKMVQHSCRVAHWVHWRKKVFRPQTFWARGPKTLSGWRPQRCSDFFDFHEFTAVTSSETVITSPAKGHSNSKRNSTGEGIFCFFLEFFINAYFY